MTEFRLIELMDGIDDDLLKDANASVPVHKKRGFRLALIAAVLAFALLLTPVAGALALAGAYRVTHPDAEGGIVQALNQILGSEEHPFSGLIQTELLDVDWDALKSTIGKDGNVDWKNFFSILRGEQPQYGPTGDVFKAHEFPDGTMMITEYMGSSESVVIPEEIMGKTVVAIGEGAFADHPSLQYVSVPSTVTSIGDKAFYGCSSLKTVEVPSGLEEIGDRAFSDCVSLESLYMSDGLADAPGKGVAFPYSLQTLGDYAFQGCSNITSVVIRPALKNWGESAFRVSGLQNVTILDGVESIPDYAFAECGQLKSVTVPHSVTSIGELAFGECTQLSEITLNDGLLSIGRDAFYGTAISTLEIPSTVTTLGDLLFEDCDQLASVIFHGDAPEISSLEAIPEFPRFMIYYQYGAAGFDPDWFGLTCKIATAITQPYVTDCGLDTIPFYRDTVLGTTGTEYFGEDAIVINTFKQYQAINKKIFNQYETELAFDRTYFEQYSIVLVKVTHSSSEDIIGLAGLAHDRILSDGENTYDVLYPVVVVDSPEVVSDDIVYTYIAVEVANTIHSYSNSKVFVYNLNPDRYRSDSVHHDAWPDAFTNAE